MIEQMVGDIQVIGDGRTVWVNDAEGVCIGRFSRFGIDVHNTYAAQAAGASQCLDCAHGDDATFEAFVASMALHHKVDVPAKFKPSRP